jgi:peptide/nickel transport system permease protein
MKNTLNQVFHSGKFVVGFCIFMALLAMVIFYPLFVPDDPLESIGKGTFFPPGTYVNIYDSINATTKYSINLDDATEKRIASKLTEENKKDMKTWLIMDGIPADQIDTSDISSLLKLWENEYSKSKTLGMTYAKQRYYQRLNASVQGLLSKEGLTVMQVDDSTGETNEIATIQQTDYVNVKQVANVRWFPLGTDNFGRDILTELVTAAGVSLQIGLVAGLIATFIGLTLGLISGYVGGWVDDVIMFITNLFTVIPSMVLLILISYSIGQDKRGAFTIATVIGLTSWVWTTRAVRSQVISLRNRDHVNLSKLSGHSTFNIIFSDILPYIMSYVIMALILQISSGILAEASLSILGLGPRTTDVPTLGLMMNWAMIYQAHVLGKWWAYLPVLVTIALITFSMNLMNTGLDQVFNPALRD